MLRKHGEPWWPRITNSDQPTCGWCLTRNPRNREATFPRTENRDMWGSACRAHRATGRGPLGGHATLLRGDMHGQ